jgi:hypothetical protein
VRRLFTLSSDDRHVLRRAIHLVELQDRQHLDEVVPASVRDNWLKQLMRERYPEPMTVLEWLRRPPRKRSRKALDEEISKWLVIRAMAPPACLDRIPTERLRAYARRMRRRRPIKVREIAEPRHHLPEEVACALLACVMDDTAVSDATLAPPQCRGHGEEESRPRFPAYRPLDRGNAICLEWKRTSRHWTRNYRWVERIDSSASHIPARTGLPSAGLCCGKL